MVYTYSHIYMYMHVYIYIRITWPSPCDSSRPLLPQYNANYLLHVCNAHLHNFLNLYEFMLCKY